MIVLLTIAGQNVLYFCHIHTTIHILIYHYYRGQSTGTETGYTLKAELLVFRSAASLDIKFPFDLIQYALTATNMTSGTKTNLYRMFATGSKIELGIE